MEEKFEKEFQNSLEDPQLAQELGPDEQAVHAAGLKHPDALHLDNIMAEDWDTLPNDHVEEPIDEATLNQFLYEEQPQDDFLDDLDELSQQLSEESDQILQESLEEEPAPLMENEVSDLEYSEEMEEEEEYEKDMTNPVSTRKGRPKRKKGYGLLGIPHMISTVIWLAITLAIGVSLGRVLWVCCADIMSFGKPEVTAYITVTESDDIESISQKLADANLIRYPGLFQKFAEVTKKADRINTGTFELGSHLDYNAMINDMVYISKPRNIVTVVFPEGFNCAQFFRILETNEVCTAAEL